MTTVPGKSSDTAEISDSRLESVSVVTDTSDRMTGGTPEIGPPESLPVLTIEQEAGSLEKLILWKIAHVLREDCGQCQSELAELLQDWRNNEARDSDRN